MRIAWITLLAVALFPVAVFAQDGPEIQVSDGKVTMSAQAIPLSRLLSLWDRAVGMTSQILKPELANRIVSVRFANLPVKDAVQKMFEGQPFNYLLIEGKGIRVTDAAITSGTSSTGISTVSAPAFQDSPQQFNQQPLALGNAQPPNQGQPAQPANPFGNQPAPVPAANANTGNPGGAVVPGQLPPSIGANNPLVGPTGNTGGNTVAPVPATGGAFPNTPAPVPSQPQGPGNLGVTPGVIAR